METSRECRICGNIKPIDSFEITSRGYTRRTCKDCVRDKRRKSAKDPSKFLSETQRIRRRFSVLNNKTRTKEERAKAKYLWNLYKIDIKDYIILFEKQSGKCAICGKEEVINNPSRNTKDLSVDHDHKTGKIRGLLCHKCNVGLGHFLDSIELLEHAIEYLKSWET